MQPWLQAAIAAAPTQAATPPPEQVPGRVLQFDGDLLAYWAGGNDNTTVAESRERATGKIIAMRDYSGSSAVVMHLTAPESTKGNRRLIATVKPYQGQRNSSRRPKNWAYLRQWLADYGGDLFKPKMWATREADDGIALQAHHAVRTGGELVAIGSGDKDMRMLPGWHINWNTFELTHVPPGAFDVVGSDGLQYGHKWFWLQMLQGDGADNIPGLPFYVKPCGKQARVGEKTAQDMLADVRANDEAYRVVLSLYSSFYGDEAKARIAEQAMLLWMRTDMQAAIGDFMKVFPQDPAYSAIIADTHNRIQEAYAQAQSLGSTGPAEDAA